MRDQKVLKSLGPGHGTFGSRFNDRIIFFNIRRKIKNRFIHNFIIARSLYGNPVIDRIVGGHLCFID